MTEKEKNEYNPFILDEIYPDTSSILLRKPSELSALYDDSIFVLDTNSLLAPFSLGKESLQEIKVVYEKLSGSKKLFIPAQCLREFAKNRPKKIKELHAQVEARLSSIPNIENLLCPLLEDVDEHKNLLTSNQALKEAIKDYKTKLNELKGYINSWNWNDPVSSLYSDIFSKDTIIEHEKDKEEILKDLASRTEHNIPPGYKDQGKPDKGIGDVIIWHTMLNIGSKLKSNVVFVSNDVKSDWMVRDNKQAITVRYELVDEFYRKTDGKEFTCITFPDFMELQGAKKEIVSEIKFSIASFYEGLVKQGKIHEKTKSLNALQALVDIIEEFIEDNSEDNDIKSIEDGSFYDLKEEFTSSWKDDYFETTKWKPYFPYLYELDAIIKKISTNSKHIQYEEMRMKRDTFVETIELKALCNEFIKIYNNFVTL